MMKFILSIMILVAIVVNPDADPVGNKMLAAVFLILTGMWTDELITVIYKSYKDKP